jgi:RecA-family ATPase
MADGVDDAGDAYAPDESRHVADVYESGFASISRTISLASGIDAKRLAWRHGLRDALTRWQGIDRVDIIDRCFEIADAKDLITAFGPDEIQHDIADEIERLKDEPKQNGNGRAYHAYHGPDAEAEIIPPLEPLPFFPATEFAGVDPVARRWLVRDRIPMGNVTILGGDGATGKTTIALQLCLSVAGGRMDWMQAEIVENGPVLFLSAEEDRDEIHRRLHSIASFHGVNFLDLGDLHIESLVNGDSYLATPKGRFGLLEPTPIYQRLSLSIERLKPRLICLESNADLFGGDEINKVQVRAFITLLRRLTRKDSALLLLSHPSLSGMASGSGSAGSVAWNNSARSRIYLKHVKNSEDDAEVDGSDVRELQFMKSNYSKLAAPVRVAWTKGVFVPIETMVDPIKRSINEAQADATFLRCLDIRTNHGLFVGPYPTSKRWAPNVFAAMSEAVGLKKQQFAGAMERLLRNGKIKVTKSPGSPSKQMDIIVRAQLSLV